MIERNIDYLQMSVSLNEREFVSKEYEIASPVKFYKRGFRNVNGTRFYFGNPNSSKCLVVMSGFALMFERLMFANDASLIENWLSKGAKITRIDLAITDYIDTSLVTVADVRKWYKKGKIESVLCNGGCKMIEQILPDSPSVPETLYIGAIKERGKRGIFRAYDKGIEMNLDALLITRLELELRGEKAHSNARRIAQTGDISGNFRATFNVNSPEFERLMDAPVSDTTRGAASGVKREQDEIISKRWHWLINTVAPSLRDAIAHDRKADNLDTNLVKFLSASGLSGEIKEYAEKYRDKILADAIENVDLNSNVD